MNDKRLAYFEHTNFASSNREESKNTLTYGQAHCYEVRCISTDHRGRKRGYTQTRQVYFWESYRRD